MYPQDRRSEQERLLNRIVNRIRQSLELQEILTTTTSEIRAFLDTDRVKIYRFDRDGSGEVIAESIAPAAGQPAPLPSLLGLRFPAEDVPPQARQMFVKVRQRVIIDVVSQRKTLNQLDCEDTGASLDQEDIRYAPVDACHVQYLSTMGVASSLSVPILHQGQLWGLLVSHHSRSRHFSERELSMVQLLVNQVSIAIAQSNLLDQARRQGWYEATLNRISRLLHLPLDVADMRQQVLEETVAALQGIGGRLYLTPDSIGQTAQLHICGEQPTCSRLEETPLWKQMMQSPQPAADHAVADLDPTLSLWEATAQPPRLPPGINPGEIFNNKTAIGLYTLQDLHQDPCLQLLGLAFESTSIRSILVVPLQYQRQCVGCLSIFRPEIETETLWAGRSHPDQRNSRPRESFEAWREIKKGQAQPWSAGEIKLAEALGIHLYMAVMQRRVDELIRHQASHDALTGLPNRLLFNERLSLALVNAHRQGERLAVIFLDLDRFKTINDTLGHAVGDRLLQVVAQRLQACLRPGDTLARWGGDEFTLLLAKIDNVTDATQVAQSLLTALSAPFDFDGQEFYIKASIGIALAPYDGEDAETLLKHADTAMYRVKQQGKNNYQIYTPLMNTKAFEQLVLENNLHKALERNEFVLHYQPQIDLRTGQLVAMETLVRWQHPVLGLIAPSQFIPIAEETGLIGAIGEWVLWTACAQYRAWQQAGLPPFRIAVNLSARQFQQRDLVTKIVRILQDNHLHPQSLELEITESIAMQDINLTISILDKLKTMGILVSMDDFGIGYSSLSSLIDFPFHALKIDQSFIYDSMTNSRKAAIIKAIVGLGHELKLQVVAEGVETAAQVEFLHAVCCDSMQGYFFSPPLPAEAVRSFCRDGVYATTRPSRT